MLKTKSVHAYTLKPEDEFRYGRNTYRCIQNDTVVSGPWALIKAVTIAGQVTNFRIFKTYHVRVVIGDTPVPSPPPACFIKCGMHAVTDEEHREYERIFGPFNPDSEADGHEAQAVGVSPGRLVESLQAAYASLGSRVESCRRQTPEVEPDHRVAVRVDHAT